MEIPVLVNPRCQKKIADSKVLAHLDLDTLAWELNNPTQRASINWSAKKINEFVTLHQNWVIEGCYIDLLELVSLKATEIIFMNLSIEKCIENARSRPWEQHKYKSKVDQDKNLNMLVEWIKDYKNRNDVFSYKSHVKFYESFNGKKKMIVDNKS